MRKARQEQDNHGTPIQATLPFGGRGGRRDGAGRPRNPNSGAPHTKRDVLNPRWPIHVTTKMLDIRTLRRGKCYKAVRRSLSEGCLKEGFRVVEFSVMSNHIHLICEATDRPALSRGLQGLFVRIAKALNRALNRKGKVFAERYHEELLKFPKQVRHALAYVLNNFRRHVKKSGWLPRPTWMDPCSSGFDFQGWKGRGMVPWTLNGVSPMPRGETWLLKEGWMQAGLIRVSAVPGPR